MSTNGSLGRATMTWDVDAAPLQQNAKRAETTARQSFKAIEDAARQSSRNSAFALLELSRGLEDLQYGFSAVVNNIPGVVTALGGSAGMAGAVSIAAVGINQLAKHWDEVLATFGNTAPFEAARGAIEMLTAELTKTPGQREGTALGMLMDATGASSALEAMKMGGKTAQDWWAGGEGAREDARRRAESKKEADEGRDAAARFKTAEQQQRAKDFRAVVEAMGGPGKFTQNDGTAAAFGRGMRGEDVGGALGVEFQRRMRDMRVGRELKDKGDVEAGMVRADMRIQAKQEKREEDRQKQEEKDARETEDIREGMQRAGEMARRRADQKVKHGQHVLWQAQDIGESLRPERAKAEFMGFADLWKHTQTGILNGPEEIAKQQLEALKRIERLIADNPEMAGQINQAVAVAAGPN